MVRMRRKYLQSLERKARKRKERTRPRRRRLQKTRRRMRRKAPAKRKIRRKLRRPEVTLTPRYDPV